MLSLSAELSQASVDLQLVNGVQVTGDGDVAHARTLADFAGAIALRDEEGLAPRERRGGCRSAQALLLVKHQLQACCEASRKKNWAGNCGVQS